MRRSSFAVLSDAIAAAAGRRLDAAAARQAAADAMISAMPGKHHPGRATTSSAARVGLPGPGLLRATTGWLASWWLDLLSRVEFALARSIVRSRSGAARSERPGARPRDGPR